MKLTKQDKQLWFVWKFFWTWAPLSICVLGLVLLVAVIFIEAHGKKPIPPPETTPLIALLAIIGGTIVYVTLPEPTFGIDRLKHIKKTMEAWQAHSGRAVKEFPVTSEERTRQADDAFETLKQKARAATAAFACQAKAIAAVKAAAAKINTAKQLPQEEFTAAFEENRVATRDLGIVTANARRAQSEFLGAWDYFTKPVPDGIILLVGPMFRDPEEFRHNVMESEVLG